MIALIILLSLLVPILTFDLPRDNCVTDVKIENQHYTLADAIHMHNAYPADAHYDVHGNLFFVKSRRRSEGFFFDIYLVKFKCKAAVKVLGLPEGVSYSIAIDKKESNVYFGTGQGIYKYEYETSTAGPVSDRNLKLNMIFVDGDSNKYITENNNGVEELYLLDNGKKIRFASLEALNELAISEDNDFYYIKDEKLFVLRSNSSKPETITDVLYDGTGQISFHERTVFIASRKLSYFHQDNINDITTIDHMPEKITALAFDHIGNFILGTQGKLLKYEKSNCYFRKRE